MSGDYSDIAYFLADHPGLLTPAPVLAVLPALEPARLDDEVSAQQAAAMDDVLEALA
jgi:hypothetical protein